MTTEERKRREEIVRKNNSGNYVSRSYSHSEDNSSTSRFTMNDNEKERRRKIVEENNAARARREAEAQAAVRKKETTATRAGTVTESNTGDVTVVAPSVNTNGGRAAAHRAEQKVFMEKRAQTATASNSVDINNSFLEPPAKGTQEVETNPVKPPHPTAPEGIQTKTTNIPTANTGSYIEPPDNTPNAGERYAIMKAQEQNFLDADTISPPPGTTTPPKETIFDTTYDGSLHEAQADANKKADELMNQNRDTFEKVEAKTYDPYILDRTVHIDTFIPSPDAKDVAKDVLGTTLYVANRHRYEQERKEAWKLDEYKNLDSDTLDLLEEAKDEDSEAYNELRRLGLRDYEIDAFRKLYKKHGKTYVWEKKYGQINANDKHYLSEYMSAQENLKHPSMLSDDMVWRLTQQRDAAYKYLKERGYGDDEINVYLLMLERERNGELTETVQADAERYAKEHPIAGTIGRIGAGLISPVSSAVGTADTLGDYLVGSYYGYKKPIDANNPYYILDNATAAYDEAMVKKLGEDSLGAGAYKVGVNITDNLLPAVVGGKWVGVAATTSRAFNGKYMDSSRKGKLPAEALVDGFVAAGFEYIFESVSLSNASFMQKSEGVKTIKKFLADVGKDFAGEASEEMLTEIANITYDVAFSGGNSDYHSLVNYYVSRGLTPEDASAQAVIDLAQQVGEAGLLGGISGSVTSGGTSGVNAAVYNMNKNALYNELGSQIKKEGVQNSVIAAAKETPASAKSHQLAQKLESKTADGKRISNTKLGRVYAETVDYANGAEVNGAGVFRGVKTNAELESRYQSELKKIMQNEDADFLSVKASTKIKTLESDYQKSKIAMSERFARKDFANAVRNRLSETGRFEIKHPEIKTKSGNATVNKIVDIKDGKITVETTAKTDNRTEVITPENIVDETARELMERAKDMTAETAQKYLEGYIGGEVARYNEAWDYYFNMGRANVDLNKARQLDGIYHGYISTEAAQAAIKSGFSDREFVAGVTDLSTTKKNHQERMMFRVMEGFAKEFGTEFIVVDDLDSANGYFIGDTNRIVISRNAEEGMLLRTAGHEAYHFIEDNSAESAKILTDFVIDALAKNGMDIEAQKAKLRKRYSKDGDVTDAQITAEIVADGMFEVLNSKEAINRFVRKNSPKTVQRVIEAIDKVIASIRSSLAKMGQKLDGSGKYVHPEIKALVDDYEALEGIRKQFMKGMESASASFEENKNKKSAEKAADGEVKFSKKQIEMNNHKITVEMSDYDRSKILKGKTIGVPIYNGESDKIIQENNLSKESKHGLIEAVLYKIAEAFDVDTSSYRIEDIEVDVTLSKNNLRESINKKANPVQLAKLLPVLKSTVENAVGIEKHANRYFYDNTTTHFENLIGGYIDGEFFVPVRFGLKHIKGGNPVLYVIIDQNKIPKKEMETEVLVHTTQQKEGSTYTHSISNFRLSQIIPFVNNKDLLRYLPDDMLSHKQQEIKRAAIAETIKYTNDKNDKKYADFIAKGNLQAAQMMVNEAAKATGYRFKLYHQTENDFTVFDTKHKGAGTGDYETPFGIFMKPSSADIGLKGQKQMPLYAKIDRPLTVTDRGSLMYELNRSERVAAVQGKIKTVNEEYDKRVKQAGKDLQNYLVEYRKNHPDEPRGEIYNDEGFNEIYEREDMLIDEWTEKVNELALESKEAITEHLKSSGYDGVIIENDKGSFGRSTKTYIALDNTQVKSADVVVYDNNDNIIPLSERFNQDAQDIRYSLKAEDDAPTAIDRYYAEAIRENRAFSQIFALMGDMYSSKMGDVYLDNADIRSTAKKILKEFGSKYDEAALIDELQIVYDYMANNRGSIDVDGCMTILMQSAQNILEKSEMKNDELWQQHTDTREFLREQNIYITPELKAEIETAYGDYKSFRSRLMGKMMHISTKEGGRTLDEIWGELNERAPEYFPKDVTDKDQPLYLTKFFESIAPKTVNPIDHYSMSMESESAVLAARLFEEFGNIGRLKTTEQKIADLYKSKQFKLKTETQALRTKLKADAAKHKNDTIEDYRRQLGEYKFAREMTDRRRRLRSEIERSYNYINRRIERETDNDHIPERLKPLAKSFIRALPDSGGYFNKGQLATFIQEYDKLKGDFAEDDFEYMKARMNEFTESVTGKFGEQPPKRRELDEFQLATLRDISAHVKYVVQNENRMFNENIKETTQQLSQKAHSELQQKPQSDIQVELEDTQGIQKLKTRLDIFARKLVKPDYLFANLGSDTLEMLYKEMHKGENVESEMIRQAKTDLDEIRRRNNYDTRWKYRTVTVKTRDGKLKLTIEEAMALYATCKRNQGLWHILNGGFTIKRIGGRRAFTLDDIRLLKDSLSKDQLNYTNETVEYITKVIGGKRNETSMRTLGIKKYNEEYYFPIETDESFNDTSVGVKKGVAKIENQSSAKRTTKNADNPVVIRGFSDTVVDHVFDSAMYCAYAAAIKDFARVYNYRERSEAEGLEIYTDSRYSIKEDVRRANGVYAIKEIEAFLQALDSGSMDKSALSLPAKFASKAKKAAVMANVSVVVQQPTSVFRAMLHVSPKYFATFATKADIEEMKKYNPGCTFKKEIGYFDINVGSTATDYMKEHTVDKAVKKDWGARDRARNLAEKALPKIDEVSGWAASKADEITWGAIWNACKKQTAAQNSDLSPEQVKSKAAELFQEVISKTQVYDSVFTKNAAMRSKSGFDIMIMQFMSEPMTTLNMLADAVVNAKNGKASKKFCAAAFACYITSLVANSAVKSLVYSLRDDDEEKSFVEKFIGNFAEGAITDPFGMIPYLKEVLSLVQGYDFERIDTKALEELLNAYQSVMNDDKTPWDKVMAVMKAVGYATGVPFHTVMRDGKAVVDAGKKVYDAVANGKALEATTGEGIKQTLAETFDWVPGVNPANKYEQLYNALIEGDTAHYNKVYNNLIEDGKEENTINNELASRLVEDARIGEIYSDMADGKATSAAGTIAELEKQGFNKETIDKALSKHENSIKDEIIADSRAQEAAVAKSNMDYDSYEKLISDMVDDGYPEALVIKAVKSLAQKEEKYDEFSPAETDPLYSDEDLKIALASGKTENVEAVYSEYEAAHGAEKAAETMRKAARAAYKSGLISDSQTEAYLRKYKTEDTDDNDIFWAMEELRGGDGYKKYGKLCSAIESGASVEDVLDYYTEHGVELKTVKSQITTNFKPRLIEAQGTEEFNTLYNNVIDAFVAAGDSEVQATKKVNKWLEN